MAENDFNSLPDRANRARSAINNLSEAFDDLSKNGTLTHRSLTAVASAIGAIPVPGAQVASVVVSIASGFLRASEAAAKLREQELADELKRIQDAAEGARQRVEAFRDAMLSGSSIQEARIAQQITDISTAYVQLEKQTTERIENLKKEREAALNSAGANKSLSDIVANWSDQMSKADEIEGELTGEQEGLAAALVDANAKIAKLKASLDELRKSTKPAKDETKALKEELYEIKGIDLVWEAYTPTPEQTKAVYDFQMAIKETGEMIVYSFGDVGAAAFDRYADAMDRVIDGHNAFSKSSGRKFQNATSEIMQALGREAAARAVMHLAMAAAGLTPWGAAMYGPPSENLKAAALFGTVAVLAGAGSAALSVKAGGGSGANGGGSGGARSSGKTLNLSLTVIGTLDTQQRKDLLAQLAEEFQEGG